MKSIQLLLLFLITFILIQDINAQNVSINDSGDPPDPSAMLDVQSIKKGVLFPKMRTDEMQSIIDPADGLMVYNSDVREIYIYSNGQWDPVAGSGYWQELIGQGIYNLGNVSVGNSTFDGKLNIFNDASSDKVYAGNIFNDYNGGNTKTSLQINTTQSGTGIKYGIFNFLASNSSLPAYGIYSRINPISSTGPAYAIYATVDQTGTGEKYAAYLNGKTYVDDILQVGDANVYETGKLRIQNETENTAVHISQTFAGPNQTNGLFVNNVGSTGHQYGIINSLTPNNDATKSANGIAVNMYSGGASNKTITGVNVLLANSVSGNKIGIKVQAPGSSNFAGHFTGRGYFSEKTSIGGDPSDFLFGALNVRNDATMGQAAALDISSNYANNVWGFLNTFVASSNSNTNYANWTNISGGASNKTIYGSYINMASASGANKYGYYINNPGHWASYFNGKSYISESLSIGTTNGATGYKLSVNGKVICEELKVELDQAWPDYVFEEDYELRSIQEMEESIQANGHLPGIPSAKEIEENGLEIGDMQKRMMEKIEELSLYIIDLDKKNKDLQQQILDLKNQ